MGVVVWQAETLLTSCVDIIAKNFDRFMYAYKSGNYELEYLFGLLQREKKISIPLLKKLLYTDKFQKYVDFLLNPYMKEIDIGSIPVADVRPILGRLKQIAPTITLLSLPWSDYENTCLPELVSSLTNIKVLSLSGRKISTETFSSIDKNCQNLKFFVVRFENNIDQHIQALVPNNNNKCNLSECLKYLCLPSIVTTEGLKYALKHFRGLLWLNHGNVLVYDAIYELHENDIRNDSKISKKYNLQKLEINEPHKYPSTFLKLCGKLFPHLRVLKIRNICSQTYVDALKALPSLKVISLWVDAICNLSSYLQEKGRELKEQQIITGTISLNSLLNSCQNVSSLKLDSPVIINDTPTSQCLLKFCKDVELAFDFGDDLNKQFVKCLLSRCPNLENLSLFNADVDANRRLNVNYIKLIIASGKWIKNLRRFDCSFANMGISALQHFVKNAPNLKIILIGKNQLTVNDIEFLKCLRPSIIYAVN